MRRAYGFGSRVRRASGRPTLALAALVLAGLGLSGCMPLAIGTAARGTRPSGNDGIGFYVSKGRIYQPNGREFIPMGYNAALNHGELAKEYHANAVRLVSVTPSFGPDWPTTFQQHRDAVAAAVGSGLAAILEMHDATGDSSAEAWNHILAYWTSPQAVQLAKDYEGGLWLNIANEHNFDSPESWRDEYSELIRDMRALGVKNLIVLDGDSAWGQSPNGIKLYGKEMLESDPQHNVLFSVHMYTYWKTTLDDGYQSIVGSWNAAPGGGGDPWLAETELAWLRGNEIPFVLGEFGWHLPASDGVGVNGEGLIKAARDSGYGFLFWELLNWPGDYYRPYTILLGQESADNGPPYSLSPAGEYIVPYLRENAEAASSP